MSISIESIQSFLEVQKSGSFSKAAIQLGLTQPALSLRIKKLEDYLQTALIVRGGESLSLTAAGEQFSLYAKEASQRHEDFLSNFNQYDSELSGQYHIAGFSSVVSSLLIPGLARWQRANSKVRLQFSSHEVVDLAKVLKSHKAEAVILDYSPKLPSVEEVLIGYEEYVIIESKTHKHVPDLYFDHGPHDNATESYFKEQNSRAGIERAFAGDVFSIISAVENGLGKAVMSKHLVEGNKKLKIKKNKKKYVRPLLMCFYRQNYYSPIHQAVVKELTESK